MPPNASVHDLRIQILETKKIDYQNQLLLLPTGENLDPNKMLSSYTSETESMELPIFLFNRKYNEENPETREEVMKKYEELYNDINCDIDNMLKNSKDFISINSFAKLLHGIKQYEERMNEIIKQNYQYHELLDNGYKTFIIAILHSLDILIKKCERNEDRAIGMPKVIEKGFDMLKKLNEKLELCKKIMIPINVLKTSKIRSDQYCEEPISLYDWIDTKDPHTSLEELENSTKCYFEHAKTVTLNDAKTDLLNAKAKINKPEIKCIKGLEVRMNALQLHMKKVNDNLNELKKKIKSYEISMGPTVTGVKLSPDRLSLINDITELKKNVEDVTNIGNKIIDSKYELLNTILQRLKVVIEPVSEQAAEGHNKIAMFESTYENVVLKGDLIKQLNDAPLMYATMTTETLRRIYFSKEFNEWFNTFNKKVETFVTEENDKREKFSQNSKKHFLKQLFTGFDDYLPHFLCEIVKIDEGIPQLNISNLTNLKKVLPEMESIIKFETPNVYKKLSIEIKTETPNIVLSSSIIRPTGQLTDDTLSSTSLPKHLTFTHFMSGDDNLEGFQRSNFLSTTFQGISEERQYDDDCDKRKLKKTNSICIPNSLNNINQFRFSGDDHFSSFDDLPGYGELSLNDLTEQNIMETTLQKEYSPVEMTNTIIYPNHIPLKNSIECQTNINLLDIALINKKLDECNNIISNEMNNFIEFIKDYKKIIFYSNECQNAYRYVIGTLIKTFIKQDNELNKKITEMENKYNNVSTMYDNLKEDTTNVISLKDKEIEKLKEDLARANVKIHLMECDVTEKDEKLKVMMQKIEEMGKKVINNKNDNEYCKDKNNIIVEENDNTSKNLLSLSKKENGNYTETDITSPILINDNKNLKKSTNSVSVQTRLHGGDIKAMISLQDIHEGCTVLIMWNPTYDAYLLSCSTNILYFVKETSVERLGLSNQETKQRRHSLIATVSSVEKCQIRRENNRYRLPVGTQFYRVDVEVLRWDTIKKSDKP
ncbi:RB1-inducible coiled-coil protein 1 [Strongyloides ratti]|uniref:RB1-inducible coiled-coil protein 1 n=1 Tax=Strongyloides ratti TaxID=34506 RepID=A0A090N0U1_STRRB|nr:RB1-inducible coiled-coil protein 1 [Strongyloides ratti]CEF71278.1 RB1-inducible coiled-coil protein 1 [Strongyloides ratti]